MMKTYILLAGFLFLLARQGFTQDHADSLVQALRAAKTDSARAAIHNEIAWELKDREPATALSHTAKGIELAENAQSIETLALLHKTTGVIHWYTADYLNARKHLQVALEKYQSIRHQKGMANVLNNLGLLAQANGDHAGAVQYLDASATIREQIGDLEGVANSCNNIGIMHFMAGEYELSLERHLRALGIWEQISKNEGRAFSLMNIGRIYLTLKNPKEALGNFSRAYEIHLLTENLRGQADALSNIADVYLMEEKYAIALDQFFLSLAIREKLGDKTGIRECLSKIGETEFAQGQIQEAIYHHLRSLNLAEQTGEKQGMLLQYNQLGRAYLANQQPEKALFHLLTAIPLALELGTKHELSKAYRMTADAYKALGQSEIAISYLELYIDREGIILNEGIAENLIEMKEKYEAEHKQRKIENLQQESTIASLQFTRMFILLAALGMAGFSVVLLYRYRDQSRMAKVLARQKQEIESQNLALAISNADLEQFAYAVSHDLKQPLRTIGSFTSLIARRYEPLLDEDGHQFIRYVTDGVSHMHHLLSDILTYSQIGGKESAETLDLNKVVCVALKNLDHLIQSEQATVEVDALPIIMGHYSGMVRLFQNLIHNGIKFHSDELPHIRITYTHLMNDHLIAVTDNGVGIEQPYLKKIFTLFQRLHTQAEYPGTGIGLTICLKVVRQHGGSIWAESQPGQGSTFLVKLPKDHFVWNEALSPENYSNESFL